MWYWILWLLIAIWVLLDAKKRRNNMIGWPIGTFLLGVIVLPVYLAKRNLKPNEVREGGTAWNVLKYFMVFWTLSIAASAVGALIDTGSMISESDDAAEQFGMPIGAGIGLVGLFIVWFIVALIALILGLFLRKSSVVEKGPTGKLAEQYGAESVQA